MEFAFFLALITERLVEHFIGPILTLIPISDKPRRVVLVTSTLVIGGLLSYGFGIDFISELSPIDPSMPYIGRALSAVLIGGGSQLLHDLWGQATKKNAYVQEKTKNPYLS